MTTTDRPVASVDEALRLAPGGGMTPWVVIERNQTVLRGELRALWEFRELLYFMVWRDVKTRYKQTALGVGWAVLQPLLTTVIFTVVFAYFARMPSEGRAVSALRVLGAAAVDLLLAGPVAGAASAWSSNANLISKVYFPRLILPWPPRRRRSSISCLTFVVLARAAGLVSGRPHAGHPALAGLRPHGVARRRSP